MPSFYCRKSNKIVYSVGGVEHTRTLPHLLVFTKWFDFIIMTLQMRWKKNNNSITSHITIICNIRLMKYESKIERKQEACVSA